MNLMDLVAGSGGTASLAQLAGKLGLGGDDMAKLVKAVGPALTRGVQQQAADPGLLAGLTGALQSGGHQKYIDDPSSMLSDATRDDGNNILGHLFGSKDVSRNVAAHAAESAGIDAGIIRKALPMLASLAMGAMSKKDVAQDPGLLGGLIDSDGDGVGLDDVLGLAKKFF